MEIRCRLVVASLLVGLLAPAVARAQLDPERRANLEFGLEGPLRGSGSFSGYGFFLWNRPHFLEDDWYLRVVVAPVYLNAELLVDHWPTAGDTVGIGGAGGLFTYDFTEFRGGREEPGESFWGHGGEVTLTYYRRVELGGRLPVEAQVRLRPQYVVYEGSGDTDPRFRLPADTPIYAGRVGLRLGGVPPELKPRLALEVSLWHEASYREVAAPYGLAERPQTLEHATQRSWASVGGIMPVSRRQTARVFLTAGTTANPDPLSSFRLGGALRFRREFPLVLHGYNVDEIFAKRFWLLNASYRVPLWPGSARVRVQFDVDYAHVDYLEGRVLPRRGLRGVGVDGTIDLTRRLTFLLGYGFGPDAPRGAGFGGHQANLMVEWKF